MSNAVELPSLSRSGARDTDPFLVDLSHDRAGMAEMWGLVLAMAVRDRADSVHYHPWRPNPLGYTVAGVGYDLVPPPPELAAVALAAARDLIRPRTGWASLGGWFGGPVAGQVRLVGERGASLWAGVYWSSGGARGVGFHRLIPLGPPPEEVGVIHRR